MIKYNLDKSDFYIIIRFDNLLYNDVFLLNNSYILRYYSTAMQGNFHKSARLQYLKPLQNAAMCTFKNKLLLNIQY